MIWQTIRHQYPQRWLLVEALEAHTEANQRLLDQLAVIDAFEDSRTALQSYRHLHRQAPQRELYVLHTSREEPDIGELYWFGVKGYLLTKKNTKPTGIPRFGIAKGTFKMANDFDAPLDDFSGYM